MNRREQPGAAAARASHLISQMTTAFDDALVENWEPHDGSFHLPDPNDEHVAAAALVGGAGAIVTENLRDFPIAKIPAHIKVLSPTEFAADTGSVSPDVRLQAVETMASRYSAPPLGYVNLNWPHGGGWRWPHVMGRSVGSGPGLAAKWGWAFTVQPRVRSFVGLMLAIRSGRASC